VGLGRNRASFVEFVKKGREALFTNPVTPGEFSLMTFMRRHTSADEPDHRTVAVRPLLSSTPGVIKPYHKVPLEEMTPCA
jgi:hypothetical protein